MIFHEIYSAYYNAAAELLRHAVNGKLTEEKMLQICGDKAFSESFLTILPALKEQRWQLLRGDLSTPLKNSPTQPLSLLQRRWLKAISLDERIALFDVDFSFLDGVEPLFTPEDIVVFDKYGDGDPFTDSHYIKVFRAALEAIKSRRTALIAYNSAKGNFRRFLCRPVRLEYSEKDDKFRLRVNGCRNIDTINLAGIESISLSDEPYRAVSHPKPHEHRCIVAELTDERNALERAMLHFAHFERETQKLSDNRYQLKITYSVSDETELLIRVLSFGPRIRVLSPDSFVDSIRERLTMQRQRGIK